jgi:hypothetical protein
MKTYSIAPPFWRWVVSFMALPLYTYGKIPQCPLFRRLGRLQSRSGHYEEMIKNFSSLLQIKPQLILHRDCSLAPYSMSHTAWAYLRNCQHVTLGTLVAHVECSQVVYHSITMYSTHISFRNASHAAHECEGKNFWSCLIHLVKFH